LSPNSQTPLSTCVCYLCYIKFVVSRGHTIWYKCEQTRCHTYMLLDDIHTHIYTRIM